MGEEGRGFKYMMEKLARERLEACVKCQAMAKECLKEALSYAKVREAFDRIIGSFQHQPPLPRRPQPLHLRRHHRDHEVDHRPPAGIEPGVRDLAVQPFLPQTHADKGGHFFSRATPA